MLRIPYIFWNICINDIYILQPKVHFQLLDIVFELKIPNKLSLAFISEVPQRDSLVAQRVNNTPAMRET